MRAGVEADGVQVVAATEVDHGHLFGAQLAVGADRRVGVMDGANERNAVRVS